MQLIAHSNLAMSGIVKRMPNHCSFDPSLDPILRIRLAPVDLQQRFNTAFLNGMLVAIEGIPMVSKYLPKNAEYATYKGK